VSAASALPAADAVAVRRPRARLGGRWRPVWGPLAVILAIILAGVLAPWIAPHRPDQIFYSLAQLPPRPGFWLGTDDLGRDILSRLIYGARDSMTIAIGSVLVGSVGGVVLGLLSGYGGRGVDWLVMRVVDVLLAIPGVVIALVVIAILGEGLYDLVIAIAIGEIPVFARLVRASVLAVREREYVEASRAIGAPTWRIVVRHILPNVLGPIIVLVTLDMGVAILVAAGLTFIGLGPPPPAPEWGAMLNEAQNFIPQDWWMAVFPGLAITVTVLSLNLLGDALRDVLDPAARGRA
jgi:ABC-type dipeptide/oligopeptide/nickel transport system permease subunit